MFRNQRVARSALARGLFTRAPPAPRTPIKSGLYGTVFALSAGLFAIYYFDARSAIHRYVFTPLLRYTLDAETGHKVAVQILKSGLGPRDPVQDDVRLKSEVSSLINCISKNSEHARLALGARDLQPCRTSGRVR
jgi:dihydroorotate dehydrogenase